MMPFEAELAGRGQQRRAATSSKASLKRSAAGGCLAQQRGQALARARERHVAQIVAVEKGQVEQK